MFQGAAAPDALAQPAPPAPDASAETPEVRAEERRQRGAALCARGEREEGIAELSAALRLHKKDPGIATDLGACEIQATLYRSAAEHLRQALRNLPPDETSPQRERAQAFFDQARARVAGLRIEVDARGADVFAGGQYAGLSPLGEDEVFVDAGDVIVSARDASGREVQKTVRVAAGGSAAVRLVMPPPTAEPDRFAPRERPSLLPAFLVGGAGVASAAVGVGLYVAAGSKAAEADDQLAALRARYGPVPCPDAPGCADLKERRRSRDGLMDIGTGFLIGGGAALAGAIGYAIWALGPPPSERGRVTVAPFVARTGGGAWVHGAF